MTGPTVALLLACTGCFALTTVSAVVPWVNAELVVLSFTAAAPSPGAMVLLVVVATAGQMTGKLVLYATGRQASRVPSPRIARLLETWRPRCEENPRHADRLVLISSAVGFPPFIMTSLLAGALRMDLLRFLIAGSIGRLIHFGALVFLGNQVARLF
jgi:membrane protein YqaA with SNARE-associated domain